MIPEFIHPFAQAVYGNRHYRFWFFQVLGWSGYALGTFLSITLMEGNFSWPQIGHIGMSAVLGILTTLPLRTLYNRTFDLPLWLRLLVASTALIALSGVWTALRILVFAWIVGVPAIWNEFNYWYFGSLFVFLSWTVLYYGIKYYELLALEHQKLLEESSLKQVEQMARVRAESSARNAQLQMLRYQLNPHFLFNTLNAINALVNLKENRKAQQMLLLLSGFLRHSLEQDSVNRMSLDRELESLMLYLDIEKVRFEDRLELVFDIDSHARDALVPGLILQPIVENAMKYAISPSEDGGTVCIKAQVGEGRLNLEVSDTGPGMKDCDSGNGWGVGLRNTQERLSALYEGKFTFETANTMPSGLTVRISFPYEAESQRQDAKGSRP